MNIKLLTLITQVLTVSAGLVTLIADHYFEQGGLIVYILLPLATLLMLAPYILDHFFIELQPKDGDLSCIQLKTPPTSQQ